MAYDVGQTCMLVNIGLTRSECASWVQAWGSVLAILGAGLIAWAQIYAAKRATLRAQRERGLAIVDAVAQLARSFSMQMASLSSWLDAGVGHDPTKKRSLNLDPFRDLESLMRAVQLHDLPDTASVKLMIAFRNLVNTSDMAVKRLAELLDDPFQGNRITAEPLHHLLLAAQDNDERWNSLVLKLSNA